MMRVNSLLPSDVSERIHPSGEPVPSMKRGRFAHAPGEDTSAGDQQ